jgi:hypothetical protein
VAVELQVVGGVVCTVAMSGTYGPSIAAQLIRLRKYERIGLFLLTVNVPLNPAGILVAGTALFCGHFPASRQA